MRRVRKFAGLVIVAFAVVAVFAPARLHAIVFGWADTTNSFPNTGAFIVKSPTTGAIYPICSGTLISPTVFLTAAHCTDYYVNDLAPRGYTAYVSFDNPIPFGELTTKQTNLIPVEQAIGDPQYNQAQSDPHDIAVLLVSSKYTRGITPATLPTAGLFDQLSAQNGLKTAVFTAVGYGIQDRVVGGGVPYYQDVNPIPRMYAFSSFNSINGAWLRLSQNNATGNGGTCYGDSGGPNFFKVNGVTIIGAITITGDAVCESTNVDYRLDTDSARGFLSAYVALP